MRKSGLLALAAASALAIGVMANEKPSDEYVKSMKDTNVAAQSLRKDVDQLDRLEKYLDRLAKSGSGREVGAGQR